ncbi:MAG: M50 family metallopeptidase [Bacteroidetes bacterium]|nr:M50 family metallopeptidase [Bacteroidota bacterium]
MEYVNIVLSYLGKVLMASFYQILAIFGFLFFFGIILYFFSRSTRMAFVNSNNQKLDVYMTGWLGTPIHELGHAFFCLLFGHKITEIKLFSPNSLDGSLGYVNHSYNPNNYYQRAGNFFIGAGPIFFGSFLLYVLMYFLLPNFNEIKNTISHENLSNSGFFEMLGNLSAALSFGLTLTAKVFTMSNFGSITFWVFFLLAFCISSHMQLSPPDIKNMLIGLVPIGILFLIVNAVTILFGYNFTSNILQLSHYTGILLGVFMIALVISVINFLLTYFILSLFYYPRYKRILSII